MTTDTLTAQPARSTLFTVARRHPLATFVALVLGLTWPFLILDLLGSRGVVPFRLPIPLLMVMGYMPTLAAVISAGVWAGRRGVRDVFARLFVGRLEMRWYLLSIFGVGVLCASVAPLHNWLNLAPAVPLLSPKITEFSPLALVGNATLLFIVSALINGEELGWRGFALPLLQHRWSALTASLLLGLLQTLFHLPLFFTVGSSQAEIPFLSFLLGTLALSVLVTWIYNHTRGSVLLPILIHAAQNTWTQIFPIDHGSALSSWIYAGVTCLAAVIIVILYGRETLASR